MLSNYVVVAVKLDDMYEGCSILHLLHFHKKLCEILKVTLGQFILDGLQPGCICVMFHLHEDLFRIVFPLSDEVIDELIKTKCHTAKIISLSCNTCIYKAGDGKKNSDTMLKMQQCRLHKEAHKKKDIDYHKQYIEEEYFRREKEKELSWQEYEIEHLQQEKSVNQSWKENKEEHSWIENEEGHPQIDKEEEHPQIEKEEEHSWKEKEEVNSRKKNKEKHFQKEDNEEHYRKEKEGWHSQNEKEEEHTNMKEDEHIINEKEDYPWPEKNEEYPWLQMKREYYQQERKKYFERKDIRDLPQKEKWELLLHKHDNYQHKAEICNLEKKEHFWYDKKKNLPMFEQHTSALLKNADKQSSTSTLSTQLDWRRGPDMPVAMSGYVQAVKVNDTLFFGGGLTVSIEDDYIVMAFNTQSSEWQLLPPYSTRCFAMTTIKNSLVLVGGMSRDGSDSIELGEWQRDSNQWTRPFPPMLTPQLGPSATSYKHWLVVVGGSYGVSLQPIVEVLDVSNMQWSIGLSPPISWLRMKSTTLGDTWYLMGGRFTGTNYVPDVYSVSLEALVSQTSSDSSNIWKKLPSLGSTLSCPLMIKESLLAIGGIDMTCKKPVSNIQRYVPETETWDLAGLLPYAGVCNTCIMMSDEVYILGNEGHTYIAKV